MGKGTIKRAYSKSRNEHHDRIVNKYGMSVKIVYDNLTQDDAYRLEHERIMYYVFDLGYEIEIPGYNSKDNAPGRLTNHNFGGIGNYGSSHTDEWKHQHSIAMSGENNPMFGVNVWDTYSEDKAEEVRKKLSESNSGKNNPMYGISPKERMDEKTYEVWKDSHKKLIGDKNPNWHNDTLKKKYENNPELKMLLSRPGKQNGMAREVFVYDLNMNFINRFDYIGLCCEWLNTLEDIPKKINSLRVGVSKAIDSGKPYKNKLFFDTKQ